MFEQILKKGIVQTDQKHFKSIRFDKKKVNVAEIMKQLMDVCDVVDMSVHEPRLEHVIKEIYRDKKVRK
ncbi:hypothetical protein COV18_03065 [Candidatus Woesearchaeota archaeon CG10_big_fil_rev_8_21_14_0_10_37_12]|nr:MAG: hypothetical protein COV18_03065 [Candidatus Woesearchaeota archaeon CG10_big_fil_rev_8_21_14_0_10_37_12]